MPNELITRNISAFDDDAKKINVLMSKSINMADSATKIASGVREKINSQAYVDAAGIQWSFERWWNEKIDCGVSYDAMRNRLQRSEGATAVIAERRAEKAAKQSTPKEGDNPRNERITPKPAVETEEEFLGEFTEPKGPLPVEERAHVKAHLAGWHNLSNEERAYLLPLYNRPITRFG